MFSLLACRSLCWCWLLRGSVLAIIMFPLLTCHSLCWCWLFRGSVLAIIMFSLLACHSLCWCVDSAQGLCISYHHVLSPGMSQPVLVLTAQGLCISYHHVPSPGMSQPMSMLLTLVCDYLLSPCMFTICSLLSAIISPIVVAVHGFPATSFSRRCCCPSFRHCSRWSGLPPQSVSCISFVSLDVLCRATQDETMTLPPTRELFS